MENNKLNFLDPGKRVKDLITGFDLFWLTSRAEGLPTTILEAMSCGLPVVATDVGSVHEVVKDGVTGFVVPPKDCKALARAVSTLLNNPGLRKQMGRTARLNAVKYYDIKTCTQIHLEAYKMALFKHSNRQSKRNDTSV